MAGCVVSRCSSCLPPAFCDSGCMPGTASLHIVDRVFAITGMRLLHLCIVVSTATAAAGKLRTSLPFAARTSELEGDSSNVSKIKSSCLRVTIRAAF